MEKKSFIIHLKHNSNCDKVNPQTYISSKSNKHFSPLESIQKDIRTQEEFARGKILSCCKKMCMRIDHRQVRIEKSADKLQKCEKCGKSFCQNTNLQKHFRKHEGDCGLKRQQVHLKTHTTERPHKCDHCDVF